MLFRSLGVHHENVQWIRCPQLNVDDASSFTAKLFDEVHPSPATRAVLTLLEAGESGFQPL